MAKEQVDLSALIPYLPEGSYESVLEYIHRYKVQLTITRQRQSVLGDYRHAHGELGHRISVNGNLNKFSFLVTLLHELAHLFTYEKFGNRVASHGREWKNEFGLILAEFVRKKIFPPSLEGVLLKTLKNPAASSCGDENLLRELKKYDSKQNGQLFVEQLDYNTLFKIKDGRIFRMGEKVRKRYKCQELSTGKWYLFSGVYEVWPISGL
jgi:SprT protein